MSNINSLWRSYLAGEGYSLADVNNMIKRALEAETGETGDINSLWMRYLYAQGYTDGDINSRMMQWLGDKGYTGGIDTRLRQALEAGDIFAAAAACTITLTGDIAAVFGGQPLDIADQVVSKTVPASPANLYGAGGPAAPVSWSGWRGVGYQASVYSTASGASLHGFTLISSAYAASVQVLWSDASAAWAVLINGGFVDLVAGSTALAKVSARVDGASGDVELVIGAATKTKADYGALAGLFSGLQVIPAATLGTNTGPSLTEGDTYEAEVYTASASLAGFGLPEGTADWCGNAI